MEFKPEAVVWRKRKVEEKGEALDLRSQVRKWKANTILAAVMTAIVLIVVSSSWAWSASHDQAWDAAKVYYAEKYKEASDAARRFDLSRVDHAYWDGVRDGRAAQRAGVGP